MHLVVGKCILIFFIILLFTIGLHHATRRRSPRLFIKRNDLAQYANATWAQPRIPRVIHQTYRTSAIPPRWNITVQSVIDKNIGDFKYRLWSDAEMHAFVQQHEPQFYKNTYVTYPYPIQRVDTFRYVLMYHLGGIYIDMDNGCNRPFKEIVSTIESLHPDATQLALFPATDVSSVDIEFMMSTPGHSIHKQFISRLHLFNHHFLFHFWTVLCSTGPMYAAFQEHFFRSSEKEIVRILDRNVYRPYFVWKGHGSTWVSGDADILVYIGNNRGRIFKHSLGIIGLLMICIMLVRHPRQLSFWLCLIYTSIFRRQQLIH